MTDKLMELSLMKLNVMLAMTEFKKQYKKVSKGIDGIYAKIMLSNDWAEVTQLYTKFFGYMLKSKRAKEKWRDVQ